MPQLPVVPFRNVDRTLIGLGIVAVRQKGSHAFYRHVNDRTTTVPHHGGRDMAPPLLQKILDDIEVAADDFLAAPRS